MDTQADSATFLKDFGESAFSEISGITRAATIVFEEPWNSYNIESFSDQTPQALALQSDVPGITNGDKVTVRGIVFEVTAVEPDSEGLVRLGLTKHKAPVARA